MADKSSTGLDENVAGVLCYLFWWVSGLIFAVLETRSNFVRFHALQSIHPRRRQPVRHRTQLDTAYRHSAELAGVVGRRRALDYPDGESLPG